MPPETEQNIEPTSSFSRLNTVTPLSKYFAMAVLIVLPLITLYLGTLFGPAEYVEVERVVLKDRSLASKEIDSDTESYVNEEELTAPHPAGFIDLRAVESTNSNGFPESDIYVGEQLVLRAFGSCNFAPYEGELLPNRPKAFKEIIGTSRVVDTGMCWFGGGGSEFYTVQKGDVLTLVGMPVSECGSLPKSECDGFGDPQILYEIDTAGVITTKYQGGLFGG